MKIFISALFIGLFSIPAVASSLIVGSDFEEGPDWTYYGDGWSNPGIGCIHTGWEIQGTVVHGGSFAARSKDAWVDGGHRCSIGKAGSWPGESNFYYASPSLASQKKLFIRFWYKATPGQTCYWLQFMRLMTDTKSAAGLEIGPEGYGSGMNPTGSGCGNIVCSDSGVQIQGFRTTWWESPFTDSDWHEYALLINYRKNFIKAWKDAQGNYTSSGKGYRKISASWGSSRIVRILLPAYYKRNTGTLNTIFYVDDVEIWDGKPPKPSSPGTISKPEEEGKK